MKKGFTLIECLVAIAIILTLCTMVIPWSNKKLEKQTLSKCGTYEVINKGTTETLSNICFIESEAGIITMRNEDRILVAAYDKNSITIRRIDE